MEPNDPVKDSISHGINTSDPNIKQALKEAIREWLDDQFATFGKFTLYGILSAAFAGLIYMAITGLGYHR